MANSRPEKRARLQDVQLRTDNALSVALAAGQPWTSWGTWGKQEGNHVLADQSEGNCQTDRSGGIQMRRDRKHGSHDAADDCVGG